MRKVTFLNYNPLNTSVSTAGRFLEVVAQINGSHPCLASSATWKPGKVEEIVDAAALLQNFTCISFVISYFHSGIIANEEEYQMGFSICRASINENKAQCKLLFHYVL